MAQETSIDDDARTECPTERNRRILIVDDNEAIHDDFRKILGPSRKTESMRSARAALFGRENKPADFATYHLESAFQGEQALDMVRESVQNKRPYALAFVDVRMPPGWDGVETIGHLWQADPDLQVVICTAYSDYDWGAMIERLGRSDRLLILKKPFDNIEVCQLASALTEKWMLARQAAMKMSELESAVAERTQELAASRKELAGQARRVELKNVELLRLKDEAERSSTAKSQFLANMSHELRTPMNAIIGYSEMLAEEFEETGNNQFLVDIRKVHTAGKHLLHLINDILDLSKIEAGRMELYTERVHLKPFLDDVVSTIEPLIQKNANTLAVKLADDLGELHIDQTKIRQCLLNLLSNAAKFTAQGQITLEATKSRENSREWVNIAVTDTGVGIPLQQQKIIFEAFTQAEASTTRRFGGTGLGLTITKHFCEMHQGQLLLESQEGVGSSFIMRLPLVGLELNAAADADRDSCPSDVASATREEAPLAQAFPPNEVLVVDDDPDARDLLARSLRRSGFAVVAASNGLEALEIARTRRPMAITLDVMMPGMDGWTVLQALKSDAATADIPVIMISMVDNPGLGYALGAADFLSKPPDRGRLEALLNRFRGDGHAFQILIVDDDANNREVLSKLVRKSACEVVEAVNGLHALQRIQDEHLPDLILLDLVMPEMDGFEFVHELSGLGLTPKIPIIVLTEKDLSPTERAFLNERVVNIRQKAGCSRSELLQEITKYIHGAKSVPRLPPGPSQERCLEASLVG